MAYAITPLIGIDLSKVVTAVDIAAGVEDPKHSIGTLIQANDGKEYVFAKADATISASTAVCDIDSTTFLVANTGGAYTSPAVQVVSGDYAWFSKANV